MRNFLLLLLACLICLAVGLKLASIERDGFGIGCEYLFIFIPFGVKYIWEH